MASRTLKIHPDALAEAESSVTWYRNRSPRAASSFLEDLERSIEIIVEAPQRWPLDEDGFRQYQLRRFPFVFFYRDTPDVVEIIAVAHARRNPGYWKYRQS
jgi:plasmid stabilization system protein ParE